MFVGAGASARPLSVSLLLLLLTATSSAQSPTAAPLENSGDQADSSGEDDRGSGDAATAQAESTTATLATTFGIRSTPFACPEYQPCICNGSVVIGEMDAAGCRSCRCDTPATPTVGGSTASIADTLAPRTSTADSDAQPSTSTSAAPDPDDLLTSQFLVQTQITLFTAQLASWTYVMQQQLLLAVATAAGLPTGRVVVVSVLARQNGVGLILILEAFGFATEQEALLVAERLGSQGLFLPAAFGPYALEASPQDNGRGDNGSPPVDLNGDDTNDSKGLEFSPVMVAVLVAAGGVVLLAVVISCGRRTQKHNLEHDKEEEGFVR